MTRKTVNYDAHAGQIIDQLNWQISDLQLRGLSIKNAATNFSQPLRTCVYCRLEWRLAPKLWTAPTLSWVRLIWRRPAFSSPPSRSLRHRLKSRRRSYWCKSPDKLPIRKNDKTVQYCLLGNRYKYTLSLKLNIETTLSMQRCWSFFCWFFFSLFRQYLSRRHSRVNK